MSKSNRKEDVDFDKWSSLISNSPYASPFQTPEFFDFINKNQNMEAQVFAVGAKAYEALCVVTLQKEKGIKGYFSRRAIIYGGPVIATTATEEQIKDLLTEIQKFYKSRAIYIEIRNFFDYSAIKNLFTANGFHFVPWLNFHLPVQSAEQINAAISKSRVRQIKKALKQGVTWQVAEKEEDVLQFYDILSDLYQSKIKKPLFEKEFFLHFFRSNMGKYLLIHFNNRVIGGIMCPILPQKAIYEFYVCGLDQEFKDQYPSIMATWAAIEYALQNNIPLFDFMGAGSPDEAYGVREFKARFGGELVEHGRYIKVLNPFLYQVGKLGLHILSKIKK